MQASQLKTLIEKYRAALAISGETETTIGLKVLANALGQGGAKATAKFLGTIEKAGFCGAPFDGARLGELAPNVESFVALLKEAGAKKSAVTDLELVLDLLRRHSGVSLTEFESIASRTVASASRRSADPGGAPVDTKKLVETYLQRLEAALGNDLPFRALLRELSADRNITKTEAIEIASRFFEPMARSTTRPKALRKILDRHEKLLDSRAASYSIGGKAA